MHSFTSTISRNDLPVSPSELISLLFLFFELYGPYQNGNFRRKLDEFSCAMQSHAMESFINSIYYIITLHAYVCASANR